MLDTRMVDMPTTDKMDPDMKMDRATILVISISDHNISVLDTFWLQIAGNNERKYKKIFNMNK